MWDTYYDLNKRVYKKTFKIEEKAFEENKTLGYFVLNMLCKSAFKNAWNLAKKEKDKEFLDDLRKLKIRIEKEKI